MSRTSWEEEWFGADLFLEELLERCFRIPDERFGADYRPPQSFAYLEKAISRPPSEEESVRFRQEIQRELEDDEEIRLQFETVYRQLTELREVIDSAGVMGCEYSTRRRIDILLQIKATVDFVSEQFAAARSGIRRIRNWVQEIKEGPAYGMLSQFAEYEGRFSDVHLQLQVGFDGTVRSFRIDKVVEKRQNAFFKNPLARFWSWFRLFARGYQISEGELVARIVETVFDAVDEPLCHFLVLIGQMEFHLAALAFRERCRRHGLETCLPVFVDEESGTSAVDLFNPLLIGTVDRVVTCDIDKAADDSVIIITGPNSGGKTRLLQTIAFLQLLGQSGIAVPARAAKLHFKTGLIASLREEHSVDQKEGRLGMELGRIRRVFERSQEGEMIVIDELCSGTNPSEGEEIFLLVISLLQELDTEVFITTHFLELARRLAEEHAHWGLAFRQVELDQSRAPTYRFVPGIAKTSLAGRLAEELGVTREQLRTLIEKKRKRKPPALAVLSSRGRESSMITRARPQQSTKM